MNFETNEIEPARLAEPAKELASIPVDVIAALGSPASQAAHAATQTIPIVMVSVGDPIREGLVASLAHAGQVEEWVQSPSARRDAGSIGLSDPQDHRLSWKATKFPGCFLHADTYSQAG